MPTLCDYFGRKKVMILGCLFIIGGAFVGAFAHNYGQLIGGRCLVGAGKHSETGLPCLVVTLNHYHHLLRNQEALPVTSVPSAYARKFVIHGCEGGSTASLMQQPPTNALDARYTAALQHSVYYIGSIVSAWLVFGLAKRQTDIGDWAWRAPTLVQAFTPTIIIISALTFLPESPRETYRHVLPKDYHLPLC